MKKIKIAHIITGLGAGGAENMLYKLLSQRRNKRFEYIVISLTDVGPVGEKIRKLNIKVIELNMHKSIKSLKAIFRLREILIKENISVIQCWMYHANLVGLLAGKLANCPYIFWNIRRSKLGKEMNKKTTILIARISSFFSNYVNKIICCSEEAYYEHQKLGYKKNKMLVIPNGFDLNLFQPKSNASTNLKEGLKIPQDCKIVGLVARWEIAKDHQTFLKAAQRVINVNPKVRFVLCGDNINKKNKVLNNWIKEFKLQNYIYMLGRVDEIEQIIPGFDILVSSSISEGFSNVIGEAMACEVPCIVTDVGESSYIVGETGYTVEPKNSIKLAEKINLMFEMSTLDKILLGTKARERIKEMFEISSIVTKYELLYESVGEELIK